MLNPLATLNRLILAWMVSIALIFAGTKVSCIPQKILASLVFLVLGWVPMMTSSIEQAVKKAGGRAAVARELGVTPEAVRQWIKKKLPAERAVDLERLSGVHRSSLRPDLWGSV